MVHDHDPKACADMDHHCTCCGEDIARWLCNDDCGHKDDGYGQGQPTPFPTPFHLSLPALAAPVDASEI